MPVRARAHPRPRASASAWMQRYVPERLCMHSLTHAHASAHSLANTHACTRVRTHTHIYRRPSSNDERDGAGLPCHRIRVRVCVRGCAYACVRKRACVGNCCVRVFSCTVRTQFGQRQQASIPELGRGSNQSPAASPPLPVDGWGAVHAVVSHPLFFTRHNRARTLSYTAGAQLTTGPARHTG